MSVYFWSRNFIPEVFFEIRVFVGEREISRKLDIKRHFCKNFHLVENASRERVRVCARLSEREREFERPLCWQTIVQKLFWLKNVGSRELVKKKFAAFEFFLWQKNSKASKNVWCKKNCASDSLAAIPEISSSNRSVWAELKLRSIKLKEFFNQVVNLKLMWNVQQRIIIGCFFNAPLSPPWFEENLICTSVAWTISWRKKNKYTNQKSTFLSRVH